jgi:hypothetical protein
MGRYSRQDDSNKWLALLAVILIILGFIILLAKALFFIVLIISLFLLIIGYHENNEKFMIWGVLCFILAIIFFLIGYPFGESEIGRLSQDAFRGWYNMTKLIK